MKSLAVCATPAILSLGSLSASARDVVLPAGTLLQCTLNEPNFSLQVSIGVLRKGTPFRIALLSLHEPKFT